MSFQLGDRDGSNLDSVQERNWVGYGITLMAITGFEWKEAKTGTKQVRLTLETPAVDGLKADAAAKRGGRVAKAIEFGSYMATDGQREEMMDNLALIAKHSNRLKEMQAIKAETFEDFVEQAIGVVSNVDLYWKLTAEEYTKKDGGTGTSSKVARYGCVKGPDFIKDIETNDAGDIIKIVPKVTATDPKPTTMTFDKENKYDYVKLVLSEDEADDEGDGGVADDAAPLWVPQA